MAVLTTPDKEKIKRVIPKANNKIIDATVARLYIAYPDPTRWVYTGLMGAIALVDDLVGHTFFLKLVDITGHRGVIWDQELYVNFEYNQDRKFFHTFEIEDCLVGLLFEDTNDASHFYKRVINKSKYGSSATVKNKSAIALKERVGATPGHQAPGPRGEFMDVNTAQRARRAKGVLYYDDVPPPEWRSLYAELESAGITEDMIADNREFIKDYIAKQGGPLVGLEPPIPRKFQRKHEVEHSSPEPSRVSSVASKAKKAPPPPPPPGVAPASSTPTPTPEPVYSPSPVPEPPQNAPPAYTSSTPTPDPVPSSVPTQSAPVPAPPAQEPQKKFKLPPLTAKSPPVRNTSLPSASELRDKPLPQSPMSPASPAYPTYHQQQQNTVHHVPPPLTNNGMHAQLPPAPPARGVPPPPPARGTPPAPPPRAGTASSLGSHPTLPPRNAPTLPLRTTTQSSIGSGTPPAPPPPRRGAPPPAPPPRSRVPSQPQPQPQAQVQPIQPPPVQIQSPVPPALPQAARPPIATPQQVSAPPPPPPMPPQMNTSAAAAPPPPPPLPPQMNASGAPPPPPPPPPMPDMSSGNTGGGLSESTGDAGRDALLASIRGAGIGALKKTDKSQLEKPSVLLQEARGEPVSTPASTSGGGAPPGQPASLADALAGALQKRKNKVAQSDDEDDDDW